MKLLIATGIFPPETGGPATYSSRLSEALTARGHEIRVITYSNTDKVSRFSHGFRVFRITRSWFKPLHYYKYFRAVKKHSKWADLIYAQGPVSEGYPAYLANKSLKKPFVVKVVGDRSWEAAMNSGLTDRLIDDFQNLSAYPSKIQKMREMQSRVCNSADLVITPSEYLKKIVSSWSVPEERIRVIHNAVNIEKFSSTDYGLRPTDSGFTIVTSGRDVPWKGFGTVDEAVREIAQEYTNVKFHILKNLPRDEFLAYLKSADLFVLNTAYEGFSHSILEAMALGVPVVTTNVGGNPEIIKDGENGRLYEYDSKEELKQMIIELYNLPEQRQKFKQAGIETAKKFSYDKMITETESVLESIIHNT